MRGRDVFLDSLRLHGVSRIFGNPGTTESPLMDNLSDYPMIEYVMHLHEGVAVGAANFYAQASGGTGVANMHVAPGLGNAIGMIYGGLKNSSPMIITAGAQDTRIRLRGPVLGHDLVAMAEPVTKWSVQVEHADEMAAIMQRAFKIANEYPKGPVFVALPINVMEQDTENAAYTSGDLQIDSLASEESIARVAELIDQSRNPAIVAGDEISRGGARDALVALSEKAGIGVHSELICGRFNFPIDHDHFRSRLGPDNAAVQQVLADNDLVILMGGSFFEEVWFAPQSPFADGTTVVHLEPGAQRIAFNLGVTLGIAGDLKDALTRITVLASDSPERRKSLSERKMVENQAEQERFAALHDRMPMTPSRALAEVAAAIPDDAVIADESITATADVMRHFKLGSSHDFFGGKGGGIGQGVAGALGAAVARPDQQVVATSGDGSAMYSIQALWTAAHHKLQILFVILSNREYRVLKHNIDQYRRRFNAPSNKPYPHMDLANPVLGFREMAAGMGVPGVQVSDPTQIAEAVRDGLAVDGPFVLDLIVEGLETR
ncbi:MAG: thiamine pyrophosphate-binding protein [Pseudomonadales bacterium]